MRADRRNRALLDSVDQIGIEWYCFGIKDFARFPPFSSFPSFLCRFYLKKTVHWVGLGIKTGKSRERDGRKTGMVGQWDVIINITQIPFSTSFPYSYCSFRFSGLPWRVAVFLLCL